MNPASERMLYLHRTLLRMGLVVGNVFAWVCVFHYFLSLAGSPTRALAATALLYVLAQLITIIATPIAAAHLSRGSNQSMVWGVVLLSGAFIYLGAVHGGLFTFHDTNFGWGVAAFAVLVGAYRALSWIPYKLHTPLRADTHLLRAYLEVLIALLPLFVGLTISQLEEGKLHVLFGAAAFAALSALPVLFVEDVKERFSWGYVYTFRQLFRSKNAGLVLHSTLEGMQGAALFLVWPIAVFFMLEGSYMMLGVVLSLTLLLILLLRRGYAWLRENMRLEYSDAMESFLSMTGWIGRLTAATPVGIVIADAYFYTVAPRRGVHTDPFSFDQAGDRGAFIDEYTALKEIALALGRGALALLLFSSALVLSLPFVFALVLIVATIASGTAALLAYRLPAASY